MKTKRKKDTIFIIVLIILVIAIIGVSYAVFTFGQLGVQEHSLVAGNLKLTLTESTIITIADAFPMSDDEAANDDTLINHFVIENTGTTESDYSLYIDGIAVGSTETKLDDSFIKYSFAKGTTETVGTYSTAAFLAPVGGIDNGLIDTDTLTAGAKRYYELKLWVTTDVDGDIAGNTWKGKIRIEATQTK